MKLKLNKLIWILSSIILLSACTGPGNKNNKKLEQENNVSDSSLVDTSDMEAPKTSAERMDSIKNAILAEQEVNISANASELYDKFCTTCHGSDGTLGKFGAVNLTSSTMSLKDRIEIITNGEGIMMGYSEQMKPEEIEALAFYLTNLRR